MTGSEELTKSAAPSIFFLHVPKAGGTAVGTRFMRAFTPEEISPTVERIPSDRDPAKWSALAGYKYISGHCGHEVYHAVGAKHRLVTNFRLPVDRIISLYDYWRNNFGADDIGHNYPVLNAPRLAREMTFAEFIRSHDPAAKLYVRNAHSRQLLDSAWLYREPNFIDLFRLKQRIRGMHWFYICEKPELSDFWFKHQLPDIAAAPLAIENPTNYAEKARTIPTADDLEIIRRYNEYDLAIHAFASELLEQRVDDIIHPDRQRFGSARIINGIKFFVRLPRIIGRIERRIAALENGGRVEKPIAQAEVSEPSAPEAAPVAAKPDPVNLRYLGYAEQIPHDRPIYIVGLDTMAAWTLRLLRSRGYTIQAFISDIPNLPESFRALPVLERSGKLNELSRDDVIVIASPHRDSLVWEFEATGNLFDATKLYQFVTEFCEKDPTGLLLDDLGISYWRTTPAQAGKFGEIWRRQKKQPPDQYVRNIEKALGPRSRFVANIGCGDGVSSDPCYPLYNDGWKGWAVGNMSADHPTGKAVRSNLALPGVALTLGTIVTPSNIKKLLIDHNVPFDCDLVRVNTDSHDGPVCQEILEGGWRPQVFCVEINADIPPPFRFAIAVNETDEFDRANGQPPRDIGLFGCSAAWAAALFHKFGYSFAQYEFGFPKAIGSAHHMIFIRDDVFAASQAAPGIEWEPAYYAEPLPWSPMKAGLNIDVRDWRHAENPAEQAAAMTATLRDRTKKVLGREISFMLDV